MDGGVFFHIGKCDQCKQGVWIDLHLMDVCGQFVPVLLREYIFFLSRVVFFRPHSADGGKRRLA